MCVCVYGTLGFNENCFRYVYEIQLRNGCDYFANRPGDFLAMNICDGYDGWERLCPYLDCKSRMCHFLI
jgi:hypothetical protein